MTSFGDSASPDVERRPLEQDGDLGKALTGLRERAANLEHQLDQVADSVSVLARRLPDLDSGVSRLAERLEAAAAEFGRVESQVATIRARAPELALWLEGQSQALSQELDGRRQAVGELAAEIRTLRGGLDASRSQLVTLEGWLEQSLAQAQLRPPGGGSESAPGGVGTGEQQVIDVDGRVPQQTMEGQIDAVLSEVAEKAGLAAAQRGEETVKQAEAEAKRRLETAARQAVDDLSKTHEVQLTELTNLASTSRDELKQARARLIAGWQGMDQAVARRQSAVLSQLDRYAATLEVRVQDMLRALDVTAARSGD
jgi:hypothetical protein